MANLKAEERSLKRNRVLLLVAPLLIVGAGLFLAQLDRTPDVHYYKEIKHPGYEPSPAYYQIEASSDKEWGDYWATRWGWALAGGLMLILIPWAYFGWLDAEVKQFNWKVLAAIWLASLLLILLPFYGLVKDNRYETKLTPEQYEANKTNLDALFPIQK
jgi:hypothetical protein